MTIEITDEDKRFVRRALTERANALEQMAENASGEGSADSFRRGASRLRVLSIAIGDVLSVPMGGSGTFEIFAERERQIWEENRTGAHDDAHTYAELSRAAACYAAPSPIVDADTHLPVWSADWERKPGDRIRDLTKAGALCAAEIDRLKRLG